MEAKKDKKRPEQLNSPLLESSVYEDGHIPENYYSHVLDEVSALEKWMKENEIENNWSLSEKLAFLRSVEAHMRTNAAMRRTELAWAAGLMALIGVLVGVLISF